MLSVIVGRLGWLSIVLFDGGVDGGVPRSCLS